MEDFNPCPSIDKVDIQMMSLRIGILISSDRSSRGQRPDLSGPALVQQVTAQGWTVVRTQVLPDELGLLSQTLSDWADSGEVDIILTTGGTGFET
jgi:molybdopterin adenylyltransferase